MARIRTVKPEFWTDEKVVGMSPMARLFFIGIWNFVDDEGRAPYSPARLKMQILPADPADPSELLGEIRGNSLITVYEIDGKEYFQVNGFTKHQKIDKRTASKHPKPPTPAESPRVVPTEGKGKEGKGEDKTASAASVDYEFNGGIIKLSPKHFTDWTTAFPSIDLRGELTARDAWLGSARAKDADRENWFISTSKYLANRNMEARAKSTPQKRVLSPFGTEYPDGIL